MTSKNRTLPEDNFPDIIAERQRAQCCPVPSKSAAVEFLDDLVTLMFPVTRGLTLTADEIGRRLDDLRGRFVRLIASVVPDPARRDDAAGRFFAALPDIHAGLVEDAGHFVECDPAAVCREEVMLCYPGFYAITVHRLAHAVRSAGVPILPRLLAEHAHSRTGIDIHPGATIGRRFFIDHGTGIVIGETTVIGEGVTMYQGVTLGATFVSKELQGVKRHPTIGDEVILYAGCTILGGDTVVGSGSIIGGNVWLTASVPPGSKVFYKPHIIPRKA